MNQLEAIIESAKTGRAWRTANGRKRKVVGGKFLQVSQDGLWEDISDCIFQVSVECEMIDEFEDWLESLSENDRAAVKLHLRNDVKAWQMCAWLAAHPGSEFGYDAPYGSERVRYHLKADVLVCRKIGERFDNEQVSGFSINFELGASRLILRPDLAEALKRVKGDK